MKETVFIFQELFVAITFERYQTAGYIYDNVFLDVYPNSRTMPYKTAKRFYSWKKACQNLGIGVFFQ